MTTESQPNPAFVKSLTRYLLVAELIATAGFISSLVVVLMGYSATMEIARNIFMISCAILAAAYFLNAFMPMDFQREENEKFGMKELVFMTILPKVLWIGCAVCMAGFFILSQNQDHNGHLNLWLIGGFTLFGNLALLAFGIVTADRHARVLAPISFRAIPLLALVAYFYLNS
jgi:hypothetical protein